MLTNVLRKYTRHLLMFKPVTSQGTIATVH